MGMERVGRTDPPGQGETGEERFGDRDLVGFLIDPDLQYRLLAVMGAKGQQLGASCSPLLAPRSVLPSKAMASSGWATSVLWTQAASTRSKLSAHNRGNNQRYKEPLGVRNRRGPNTWRNSIWCLQHHCATASLPLQLHEPRGDQTAQQKGQVIAQAMTTSWIRHCFQQLG